MKIPTGKAEELRRRLLGGRPTGLPSSQLKKLAAEAIEYAAELEAVLTSVAGDGANVRFCGCPHLEAVWILTEAQKDRALRALGREPIGAAQRHCPGDGRCGFTDCAHAP